MFHLTLGVRVLYCICGGDGTDMVLTQPGAMFTTYHSGIYHHTPHATLHPGSETVVI